MRPRPVLQGFSLPSWGFLHVPSASMVGSVLTPNQELLSLSAFQASSSMMLGLLCSLVLSSLRPKTRGDCLGRGILCTTGPTTPSMPYLPWLSCAPTPGPGRDAPSPALSTTGGCCLKRSWRWVRAGGVPPMCPPWHCQACRSSAACWLRALSCWTVRLRASWSL